MQQRSFCWSWLRVNTSNDERPPRRYGAEIGSIGLAQSAASPPEITGLERYKVILAYDGTHFFGFQRQGTDRTVQLEVEAALRRLNWQGRAILSSGRTDTGVHATGQVIAFDMDWKHGTDALRKALSSNLPPDVSAKSVEV